MSAAPSSIIERIGLRNKLVLSFVFVIIIATSISSTFSYQRWKKDYYAQVREEGTVLAQTLAQGAMDPILRHDFSVLDEYEKNLLKKKNLVYVIITDRYDNVLVGREWNMRIPPDIIKKGLENTAPALIQTYLNASHQKWINDVSAPVLITGKKWGAVRVGLSLDHVQRELYSYAVYAVSSALLSIAGAIIVALILTRIITKPVRSLIASMRTISAGDLSQKIDISSPDEFGQMADSFNWMALSLRESKEELKKSYEELAQKHKLAALGELAARVAHEIKNPLGIIKGSAQILLDTSTPQSIKDEVARFIIEETDKLNRSLMDILNYARPRITESIAVDINSLIEQNRSFWETAQIRSGRITLTLRLAEGLHIVKADPDLLRQALLNILLNAFEAVEGQGEVIVETAPGENSSVAISITDTGTGIRKEDLEKIFEPFFTTKQNGGTGLGLSIVRSIVEGHGGVISVSSVPGKGTTVTILMPAMETGGIRP